MSHLAGDKMDLKIFKIIFLVVLL